MVNDKIACGIHYDKKKDTDLLMARIGEESAEKVKDREGCHPMDFTGRPMKGYVFVTPDGFDAEEDLEYWLQLCLTFNPMARLVKRERRSSGLCTRCFIFSPCLASPE